MQRYAVSSVTLRLKLLFAATSKLECGRYSFHSSVSGSCTVRHPETTVTTSFLDVSKVYSPGTITPTVAGSVLVWKAIDLTFPPKYSFTVNGIMISLATIDGFPIDMIKMDKMYFCSSLTKNEVETIRSRYGCWLWFFAMAVSNRSRYTGSFPSVRRAKRVHHPTSRILYSLQKHHCCSKVQKSNLFTANTLQSAICNLHLHHFGCR